jgi:lipid-binding SYLF domain-containing protein
MHIRTVIVSALVSVLAVAATVPADAAPRRAVARVCTYNNEPAEQARLVDMAERTIANLRADRGFDYAADVLSQAKAVLIIPKMVKGGFIIGGEGGDGVVLVRSGIHWSNPSFYSMGAATLGLQAGIQDAELVLFIMSDRVLEAIKQDEFKITASAGLAIFTVGANAHGANTPYGDIVVWSRARGVYAGVTVNGSTIRQRHRWNNDWYGRHVTINDVLTNKVCNYRAQKLRLALHW